MQPLLSADDLCGGMLMEPLPDLPLVELSKVACASPRLNWPACDVLKPLPFSALTAQVHELPLHEGLAVDSTVAVYPVQPTSVRVFASPQSCLLEMLRELCESRMEEFRKSLGFCMKDVFDIDNVPTCMASTTVSLMKRDIPVPSTQEALESISAAADSSVRTMQYTNSICYVFRDEPSGEHCRTNFTSLISVCGDDASVKHHIDAAVAQIQQTSRDYNAILEGIRQHLAQHSQTMWLLYWYSFKKEALPEEVRFKLPEIRSAVQQLDRRLQALFSHSASLSVENLMQSSLDMT